jgi:hypothetical protein
MTLLSGGFTTFLDKRKREDFSDIVSMITPEETPVLSSLDDVAVKGTKHEWSLDALATPVITNAQLEGDVYTWTATVATSRVGNYTQISRKTFAVTKTQEAIDKAGMKSEVGAQRAKTGAELKTDIEAAILSNNASVAGAAGTARQSAGLRAWIATNDSLPPGGSPASGGYNSGTGVVDAATTGDLRAFTKTLLDDNLELVYKAGGSPTALHCSPYVKRVFSTLMSDANVAAPRFNTKGDAVTIVGAADVYRSDFGLIDVVPNRQMARVGATISRNAFLLDPSKVKIGWLRRIAEDKDIAPNADAVAKAMNGEWTLVCTNEKAHGCIADVFGMTAAT